MNKLRITKIIIIFMLISCDILSFIDKTKANEVADWIKNFDIDVYVANQMSNSDSPINGAIDYYYNTEFPSTIMVDSLKSNESFQANVQDWQILTFNPSNVTNYVISEIGYYEVIIFNSLNSLVKSDSIIDKVNSDYLKNSKELFNIYKSILKELYAIDYYDGLDINTITKIDINELQEQMNKSFKEMYPNISNFAQYSGIINDIISGGKIVESTFQNFQSFISCSQLCQDMKNFVSDMYEQCDESKNPLLKKALHNVNTSCQSIVLSYVETSFDTIAQGFTLVFNNFVDDMFNSALAANPLGQGVLIGQSIGKGVSNILFSTDSIIEHYYKMCCMKDYEKLVKQTVLKEIEGFKANPNNTNANKLIAAVDVLHKCFMDSCEMAKTYANIIYKESIAGVFTLNKKPYNQYLSNVNGIACSARDNYLVGIWDNYKILLEADYPEVYEYYMNYVEPTLVEEVKFEKSYVEWGINDEELFWYEAYVYPEHADNKKIIYKSSNPDIVDYIDGKPVIYQVGECVITAKSEDGGYTDQLFVSIIDGEGNDAFSGIKDPELPPTKPIEPVIPKDYIEYSNLVLHADKTINGNVKLVGNIALNGYNLTINGDVVYDSGTLSSYGGILSVNGDFYCYGDIFNLDLVVSGDFRFYGNVECSTSSDSYSNIVLNGDAYFYGGFEKSKRDILCSLKFTSNDNQKCYIDNIESALYETIYFTNIRKENSFLEVYGPLKTDQLKADLYLKHYVTDYIYIPDSNYQIIKVGANYIFNGYLKLNGGELYCEEDFIQNDSKIMIGENTLFSFNRNFLQNKYCELSFENNRVLECSGDFVSSGELNGNYYIGNSDFFDCKLNVDGDLKLYGSMYVNDLVINANCDVYMLGKIIKTGNINLNFTSKMNQALYIEGDSTSETMKIDCIIKEKGEIEFYGHLEVDVMKSNLILKKYADSYVALDIKGYSLLIDDGYVFNGNISVNEGTIICKGDFFQEKGNITLLNKSVLTCNGEFIQNNGCNITKNESYFNCEANYVCKNSNGNNKISLKIKGNLSFYGSYSAEFEVECLSDGYQKIETDCCYIYNLKKHKGTLGLSGVFYSIYLSSDITIDSFSEFVFDGMYLNGYHMNVNGDYISKGYINLDGGIMSVNGNLNHLRDEIVLNGGTLLIEGNYLAIDESDSVFSEVVMNSEYDKMIIKKDYVAKYGVFPEYNNGILEIGGDFYIYGDAKKRYTGSNHLTVFSKDSAPKIHIEASNFDFGEVYVECGEILIDGEYFDAGFIKEDIVINSNGVFSFSFYGSKQIIINSDVIINKRTDFTEGEWIVNGNLTITGNDGYLKIYEDSILTVNGNVYVEGDGEMKLNISGDGKLVVSGDLLLQNVYCNLPISGPHAIINVGKDLIIARKIVDNNGKIMYLESESSLEGGAYITVGNDFVINTPKNCELSLMNGSKVYVGGDFVDMNQTFKSKGDVILNGNNQQYVDGKFSSLILKQALSQYNFSDNTKWDELFINEKIEFDVKTKADDYKSFTISWPLVEYATSYNVYRKNYTKDSDFELVHSSSKNKVVINSVMTGKTYLCYVEALIGSSVLKTSDIVSVSTKLNGKPKLKMQKVTDTKFELSWNKIDGATRYIIYRKRNTDSYKKVLTLGRDVYSYTTSELPNGEYSFVVKAARYDSKDRVMTDSSNTVKGIVEKPKPSITLTAGTKQIKVSWKKLEGVTHYVVYRASSENGKYSKLKTTKETSYISKSLTKGKEYYFKVRGYKSYNNGKTTQKIYTSYSSIKSIKAK